MGKATLTLVLGSIVLFTVYNTNINRTVNLGAEIAVDRYSEIQARNLANSMVNILLSKLASDVTLREEDPVTKSLFGGTVDYRIIDTALVASDTLIKIEVTANFNSQEYTVNTFTQAATGGWVPPFVRAAWTANADLNNTISDMYIDGRDHDLNENVIPHTGQYGVSSSTNFTNTQNAAIGGTKDSVDYPMTYPENPNVIEENYNWGGNFPTSPDEILGYPEGTLKAVAQSGAGGSQYVLNPGQTIDASDLTFPISGVTYIEITDGQETEWKSPTITGTDQGILIIHGPNCSSRAKGVKMDKNAQHPFTGLLITDYSFHHHIDILGAVLQLSPDLEMSKNCNGNKDHWVYYSSEAIINATELVATETGLTGNKGQSVAGSGSGSGGSGFGMGRQKALHWYE